VSLFRIGPDGAAGRVFRGHYQSYQHRFRSKPAACLLAVGLMGQSIASLPLKEVVVFASDLVSPPASHSTATAICSLVIAAVQSIA